MDIKDSQNIFIGLDGGASKTKGVLFDIEGVTLSTSIDKGTNLNVYKEIAAKRVSRVIQDLLKKANVDLGLIKCIGLGIAGCSDQDGRDLLFKELDRINLSDKVLLSNDAEAAYQICCPNNEGLLITVGTGVICVGRNQSGKLFRTAGKGHYSGDIGSGFWIGYQTIVKLSMNDEICIVNPNDTQELIDMIYDVLDIKNLDNDLDKILKSNESIRTIASLTEHIIYLAENQNEIALSIIQEGTTSIADYIIDLANKMDYKSKKIVLAANGSVIKNKFFRKALNDALQFSFEDVSWIVSRVSPAYGAAILAAKYKNVNIELSKIIKGI